MLIYSSQPTKRKKKYKKHYEMINQQKNIKKKLK